MTSINRRFMAVVRLSGLDRDAVIATMPAEDAVVRELMDEGIVTSLFVRGDLSGAFIVGSAQDEESYRLSLSRLPLFPHMNIDIVPLFDDIEL